jgi:hypothetical protein
MRRKKKQEGEEKIESNKSRGESNVAVVSLLQNKRDEESLM